MTAAEIAEAIYDCACDNARDVYECPVNYMGYRDPADEYLIGGECEDVKLPLGENITLWISAKFSTDAHDNMQPKEVSVSVYDAEEDDADRYDAYRDAIRYELQKLTGNRASVAVEY